MYIIYRSFNFGVHALLDNHIKIYEHFVKRAQVPSLLSWSKSFYLKVEISWKKKKEGMH